jgi:hypothetical protein
MEDAEEQTFACFVTGNAGEQASGHAVVRNVVETVELAASHVDGEVVASVHLAAAFDAAPNRAQT